jgi:hypothetical protein
VREKTRAQRILPFFGWPILFMFLVSAYFMDEDFWFGVKLLAGTAVAWCVGLLVAKIDRDWER